MEFFCRLIYQLDAASVPGATRPHTATDYGWVPDRVKDYSKWNERQRMERDAASAVFENLFERSLARREV